MPRRGFLLLLRAELLREAGEKLAREAVAKRICAVCQVRQACLDYALETREGHGVWGGLNETERRAVLRRKALEAS